MTMILLGAVFLTTIQSLLEQPVVPVRVEQQEQQEIHHELDFEHSLSPNLTLISSILDCYALTCQTVYRHSQGVAGFLELATSCLCQSSGHLYYLGADTLGAMG